MPLQHISLGAHTIGAHIKPVENRFLRRTDAIDPHTGVCARVLWLTSCSIKPMKHLVGILLDAVES
jgi:hypothetical protein